MATGKQAAVTPAANTDTTLYSPGGSVVSTSTVSICNTSASPVTIRLGLANGAVGTINWGTDAIEYESTLAPNQIIERTGIVYAGSQTLVCRASATGVSFIAYGFEQ